MRRLLALAALVSAGCAVGPGYERPATEAPPAWRTASLPGDSLLTIGDSGARPVDSLGRAMLAPVQVPVPDSAIPADSVADLQWWELLRDDTLHVLLQTALVNNRDLRAAAARVDEFRAQYRVARGPILPQVSANGILGTNQLAFGGAPLQYDVVRVAGELQWELDFFGRIRRGMFAARSDELAREEDRRAAVLSIVSEVAVQYFTLRQYDQQLAIAERTLKDRLEFLHLVRRRFEQGLVSELDLKQFEAEVANPAAQVAQLRRQVVQQENLIAQLLGLTPGATPRGLPLAEQVARVEIPAGIPSQVLDRRPDVLAAERNLEAATNRIGVAWGDRLPRFLITGIYGRQNDEFSGLFDSSREIYQAQLGVSIPLFTGGQLAGRVDVARAQAEQARLRWEQTVLTAYREVDDALIGVRTARDQVEAKQAQVDALRQALHLSELRYNEGLSSYIEVLDAQRNLFSAELDLTGIQRGQLATVVQLFRSLGGGWPVEGAGNP
jgi:multidrug efflux system outer membrane protein